ncbi:MAG TPA: hypothetical protein VGY77_09380 [Gemmataceae bacterium]|nr:hypothetical protein [Gemmataceae bacterium]
MEHLRRRYPEVNDAYQTDLTLVTPRSKPGEPTSSSVLLPGFTVPVDEVLALVPQENL